MRSVKAIVMVKKRSYQFLFCTCVLMVFLFPVSCKKQAPVCRGNCEAITANGNVINKLTNTGAAGVPVALSWVRFTGSFSQSEVIAKANSKTDGSFEFTTTIDTSYFSKGYFLSLGVNSNKDYIMLGYSGTISTRAYSFDPNAFRNKQFEVYRKANLKVRLHRTQNDNFQSYSISHANVVNDFFLYDYNVQSPQEVIDKNTNELSISTVADVYTKIRTVKTFANGTSTTTIDSVKCAVNATSFYDVHF